MNIDPNAPIVVGIDGSAAGGKALEWAAEEAELRHAPLRIVHAAGLGTFAALSAGTASLVEAEVSGFGNELLAEAARSVAERHPSVAVTTQLRLTRAAEALIELSKDARLLVVGRGKEGRLSAAVLGSITHWVAAHAECPTVIVNERAHLDGYAVVVGISNSESGSAAMRFAAQEAQMRGGHVLGIRCWSDASFGLAGIGFMVTASIERWQAAEQYALDTWLAQARAEFPELTIKARLSSLPIDEAIRDASHRAALVVLGARRLADAGSTRLGPVASWAMCHADCPVAITTHREPSTVAAAEPLAADAAVEPATS